MDQKINFYTGIDDDDPNQKYKIEMENVYFNRRISLGGSNEKLNGIIARGVFGAYVIKGLIVNSVDAAVWERCDEALVPYQPKISRLGELVNPWLEQIFSNQGYEVGIDVMSDQGDYHFSSTAIAALTLQQLQEILSCGHASEVEIKLEERAQDRAL